MNKDYKVNLNEQSLRTIIEALKQAIKKKDKAQILKIYDEAKNIRFGKVNNGLCERYEQAVDKANEVLYS